MPQTAQYYPDLKLVACQAWGTIRLPFFSAQMAEWMYAFDAPEDHYCLTDLRGLHMVDGGADGMQGLVTLQARIHEDIHAPVRSAILADTPVGIVSARLFEQMAQGVLDVDVRLFRQEPPALGFLGFRASNLEALLASQNNVVRME